MTVEAAVQTTATEQPPSLPLRVLTCGSVDDGKSTLIGRLLWDATQLPEDQRQAVTLDAKQSASGETLYDFSRLVDGLQAEREQGITIDIAWRYADLPTRRLVFIDAPGHEQYTRNMVTGASQAHIALVLVDARLGVTRQTRRHAAICRMAGVERLIVAINKMDLLEWSRQRFSSIAEEMRKVAGQLGFDNVQIVPTSALLGDNVTHHSKYTPWYDGPTILDELVWAEAQNRALTSPFRFPVQYVIREGFDFRGYAGTVISGSVKVGDRIKDAASGVETSVARIVTMDGDLAIAREGQSVVLLLSDDRDIARGSVLAHADDEKAEAHRRLNVRLVWLHEKPFDAVSRPYIRTIVDSASCLSVDLQSAIDLASFDEEPLQQLGVNDIAVASITLARPLSIDKSHDLAATGRFILVDPLDGATLAAGIVEDVDPVDDDFFDGVTITRAMLASELCSDLGSSPEDEKEFKRRAKAVTKLINSLGLPARLE
jgi:bifunctional enzyme CysN/CysC